MILQKDLDRIADAIDTKKRHSHKIMVQLHKKPDFLKLMQLIGEVIDDDYMVQSDPPTATKNQVDRIFKPTNNDVNLWEDDNEGFEVILVDFYYNDYISFLRLMLIIDDHEEAQDYLSFKDPIGLLLALRRAVSASSRLPRPRLVSKVALKRALQTSGRRKLVAKIVEQVRYLNKSIGVVPLQ